MKSILILTDFSEAAFRAAEYACELVDSLQVRRIILYHTYQSIVVGTDLPTNTTMNDRQIYLDSMEALGLVHDRLRPRVGNAVQIDLLAEATTLFPDSINALCRREAIDLIVLGVSGKSSIEKFLMGSVTAQVLQSSEFPALIVPEEAVIGKGIKSIVFAADLKDASTMPVNLLYKFLDAFPAELHVVNVLPEAREKYSPETEESIAKLHTVLDNYKPAFHYIQGDDVVANILSFVGQHHASLIVAVPKKHGFLTALFHKRVSKKLAYNTQVPLLVLPAAQ